jgi:YD repeat-containing protein
MTKQLFVIILVLFAIGCARPLYTAKSDAEKAWMSGGVRQIRETIIFQPSDPTVLPDTLGRYTYYRVTDYNRAGNVTIVQMFSGRDSTLQSKKEYFHDPSGKRLERILLPSFEHRGLILFDYPGQKVYTILCNYDDQGRLLSEIGMNGSYRWDFCYDHRNYPTTQILKYDKKQQIEHYSYNAKGRLKRIQSGNIDAKYRYHPNGVLAKIREKNHMRTIKSYNKHGDLETEIGRLVRKDKKGRVIERRKSTTSYQYEYDERGNWIRQTLSYNGKLFSVTLRQISYWDE